MQLHLELFINHKKTGHVASVWFKNGQYLVSVRDLKAANIPLTPWHVDGQSPFSDDTLIPLNSAKNVKVEYESHQQQLLITILPDHFSEQFLYNTRERQYYPAMTSTGMLFNYDFYTHKNRDSGGYANLWTEERLFGNFGTLSNSGIYRHAFDGADKSQDGYVRYDTYWQYSNENKILTFEAGDLVTRTLSWNNAVRLGGFQISRNFNVRPDVVTYPLPQFSGSSSVPTALDLFIDGTKVQSDYIDPGPFTMVSTPFINGAGEAVVVTRDALGRQVSTTIPFYVTNELLTKGLVDFSLGAGALRKRYGVRSFDYGLLGITGSLRYGLTDSITVESHTEGTRDLKLGGLGLTMRLGVLGVMSSAYSRSNMNQHSGGQSTIGYQYNSRYFNLTAQQIHKTSGYRDLSSVDFFQQLRNKSTQVTVGIPLGNFGNLSAGYFSVKNSDNYSTTVKNLTWNFSPGGYGTFYISANKSSQNNEWAGFLQWIIPLGKTGRENVSIALKRDENKNYSQRVDYSRSVPSDGGLGWNLGYQHDNSSQENSWRQADMTWRTAVMQLSGGVYGSQNNENYWGGASGSIALMDGHLFPSNEIYDAFTLVATDGIENVPVSFENNLIGKTNKYGHLMIPTVPAYYHAKYEIDTLNLPIDMRVSEVEQRVAVKSGSGYILRFPMRQVLSVSVKLVDPSGNILPVGSLARLSGGQESYVGMDGLAYFEDITGGSQISVSLPNGQHCIATLVLPEKDVAGYIQKMDPLMCSPE